MLYKSLFACFVLPMINAPIAAVSSIPGDSDPSNRRPTSIINILRIVIVVILIGLSAYLLAVHREWFDDPKRLKTEVVAWGAWGPIIYMLLYAIGPSFLVPGAVMT